MKIYFKDELEQLSGSSYNNNLFKMPIELDDCNILFVHCDEMTNELHCRIGNLNIKGKFEPKYYFAPEQDDGKGIYFDLFTQSIEDLWT